MEAIRHICIGNGKNVGNYSVSLFPHDYKRKDTDNADRRIRWAHFYCHGWQDVLDVIDLVKPDHVTVRIRSWFHTQIVDGKRVELDARD